MIVEIFRNSFCIRFWGMGVMVVVKFVKFYVDYGEKVGVVCKIIVLILLYVLWFFFDLCIYC